MVLAQIRHGCSPHSARRHVWNLTCGACVRGSGNVSSFDTGRLHLSLDQLMTARKQHEWWGYLLPLPLPPSDVPQLPPRHLGLNAGRPAHLSCSCEIPARSRCGRSSHRCHTGTCTRCPPGQRAARQREEEPRGGSSRTSSLMKHSSNFRVCVVYDVSLLLSYSA